MTSDDEFRPRLGRIRTRGGKAAKRYLGKLYATMEKARPGVLTRRSGGRFMGAKIGRGAGLGAVFASNGTPFGKFRGRRVAVKIRSVRLGANGLAKARAHLRYIQRDGADKEGAPGKLYGPDREVVDGNSFLDDGKEDRHQFRIIISPEEAGELADLNSYTRDVMSAAEKDLGAKLDWVAVNHFDTDHPHIHVVLRGRSDDGCDLVIARDYITHGFRKRAEEVATLELGPRRNLDIAKSRLGDVEKERFTSIDRELIAMGKGGVIELKRASLPYDRFRQKLVLARLRALEKMQLANRERDGWRLSEELETTLKQMGRRGDIIRSMSVALGDEFAPSRMREFGEEGAPFKVIGRVMGAGAVDDAHEKRFLVLDGVDGNQWSVVFDGEPGAMPPKSAVVEALRTPSKPRSSDLTIAKIAERNGGIYSDALHARAGPSATAEFRLAHKRRLEALRRVSIVTRDQDGSWRIPSDFLQRAASHEQGRAGARIRVLSWVALDQLPEARAQTFLDDVLEKETDSQGPRSGFGSELDKGLASRRQWLIANGLASEAGDQLAIRRTELRVLESTAMDETAKNLSHSLVKPVSRPVPGERIEGTYRRPIDLPAGRFALIEKSKEFTLVPWRAALERNRGKAVSGLVRENGISWGLTRGRNIS